MGSSEAVVTLRFRYTSKAISCPINDAYFLGTSNKELSKNMNRI